MSNVHLTSSEIRVLQVVGKLLLERDATFILASDVAFTLSIASTKASGVLGSLRNKGLLTSTTAGYTLRGVYETLRYEMTDVGWTVWRQL